MQCAQYKNEVIVRIYCDRTQKQSTPHCKCFLSSDNREKWQFCKKSIIKRTEFSVCVMGKD